MFEPFIEDEVPFDEYCQSMEKEGTWAGHMELQAASLVTHCNICIHRVRPFSSVLASITSTHLYTLLIGIIYLFSPFFFPLFFFLIFWRFSFAPLS